MIRAATALIALAVLALTAGPDSAQGGRPEDREESRPVQRFRELHVRKLKPDFRA
jgi:hypothetical protein